MPDLLIATNNAGKLREFERLFRDLGINLTSLRDHGIETEIEESGDTFELNASLKAAGYAVLSGVPTLADDSGLVIDHLNGAPGVRSARYAGDNASDQDRVNKVLREMKDARQRTGRFVCVISLADAGGNVVVSVDGKCEGIIVDAPRGSNGFGYDPIFLPNGFDRTFGELDAETKNSISHRARAAAKIIPFLRGFFKM
jgi:XTP/dITP diphosphohydrolase